MVLFFAFLNKRAHRSGFRKQKNSPSVHTPGLKEERLGNHREENFFLKDLQFQHVISLLSENDFLPSGGVKGKIGG